MSGLALWWQGRSRREQLLLGVMGALLPGVLIWLLIARPLSAALDAARAREAAAAEALGAARARADVRRTGLGETAPLPLAAYVARSAADAGYPNARVTASGPARATLSIEAARPQALFGWIADLETHGVAVETLRATAGADHTVAVAASLRARGSR